MDVSELYNQKVTYVEFACIDVELTAEDVENLIRKAIARGHLSSDPGIRDAIRRPAMRILFKSKTWLGGSYAGHTITIQYPTGA